MGEGDQVRQNQTGVRCLRASDRRWGHGVVSLRCQCLDAIGGEADVGRPPPPCRSDVIDPQRSWGRADIPQYSSLS